MQNIDGIILCTLFNYEDIWWKVICKSIIPESGVLSSMTEKRSHEETAEIKVVVFKYL